ncbi:MAG: SEC-C domain-containing protein, partial [Clostridiales bacterium]|nr:SEC-C domain-containing protein [Clostridiales bacterium]
EKAKTAVLTAKGIAKAEKHFGVENLSDPENFDLQHYINNALKANGTMERDQKYVVTNGEVIIVDDFTGRLMYGRRFSDGLHQAIEAKEGVKVERESKTLATITFQNYFRMYEKLAGMTGTAFTEESEFRQIYSLDVIQIPTNKPIARIDEHDAVYKNQSGKYAAVLRQVKEAHEKGQPVLVGTVEVSKSEFLSKIFTRAGIKHDVLNAKNHLREAEIVAQAGRYGAVTIATNMAGRGTDILLGGNPEFMAKQEMRKLGYTEELIDASTAYNETDDEVILEARERFSSLEKKFKEEIKEETEKVREAGGLFIVGTERHESRRIDNQLRGRAGRQGDPGRTKFFLALDDDLMRLFGGDRATSAFEKLGVDESVEIQSGILSKQIESAQKKVEGMNFSTRRHVLEYDDVMNVQRNLIYEQRRKVLDGVDIHDTIKKMTTAVAERTVERVALDGNIDTEECKSLKASVADIFGDLDVLNDLSKTISEKSSADSDEISEKVVEQALAKLEKRDEDLTPEIFREAERQILLFNVDQKWMDHIDAMDQLRNAIGMRSVGQKDPVVEYRIEGSEMFDEMNMLIQNDTVRLIMKANIEAGQRIERKNSVKKLQEGHGNAQLDSVAKRAQSGADAKANQQAGITQNQPVKRDSKKVGRNDPCPCGSGKKYKNCCGKDLND